MARQLSLITAVDGNQHCADCGAPDPVWGSINIGVAVCIECSGVHRSLGAHLTKVRSFQLDVLDPGTLEILFAIGNTKANHVWEATLGPEEKPIASATREVKNDFILSKYQNGSFLPPALRGPQQQFQEAVLEAAKEGNAALLAASLKVADEKGEMTATEGDALLPAMFAAAAGGHEAVLRLIINEGNVNNLAVCDMQGNTARQIAGEAGHETLEKILEDAILAAAAIAAEEAARAVVAAAKAATEAGGATEAMSATAPGPGHPLRPPSAVTPP